VPELPEITAHAERLAARFTGAKLTAFRPLQLTVLKTFDPKPIDACGLTLTGAGRRGKYLTLHFDDELTFLVHLMQGGRLRSDPTRAKKPRGGMAHWEFANGDALLLTESGTEHNVGVWLVRGETEGVDPLAGLGPDVDTVTREQLTDILHEENARIHGFLRRQRHIAGVGRFLANEILHAAKLSPFAMTSKLAAGQIDRLHVAMQSVVAASIEHERTLDDIGRSADRPNLVHHRIGFGCRACDDEIRSVEYRRYTVAYCPTCQTDGNVLADNTTSRFLK